MSHRPTIAAAAALALSCTVAAAAATDPSEALRREVPRPGQLTPARAWELAGQTADGRFGVAIVRSARSSVVAYICDGRGIGRWLTGEIHGHSIRLSGRNGTQLVARLSADKASGTLRLAGHAHRFTLPRAHRWTGLRRLVVGNFEAGWVLTNEGRLVGVATKAGKAVAAEDTGGGADGAGGEGASAGGSSQQTDSQLFRRFRCAGVVTKISQEEHDRLYGTGDFGAGLAAANQRFDQLHCEDFFVKP